MSNTLLGGAIGDALGVPFEKKSFNDPLLVNWDTHTFLGSEHHKLKPKQYSDDTQFSLIIAQSLIENKGFNPDDLAKRYVNLFTSGEIRGYGRTTLQAIENLKSGIHWSKSGVLGSFGNGTAMRAAPFGIYYRNDIKTLIEVCRIDSAITHASAEAEAGSLAIALTTALIVNSDETNLLSRVYSYLPNSKVKSLIFSLQSLLGNKAISPAIALRVLGTKADVRETVPSALYLYMSYNNYRDGVIAAIKAGGDADTTAAIVGSLFGTKVGRQGIDSTWVAEVENSAKLIELDSQLYHRSNGSFLFRK